VCHELDDGARRVLYTTKSMGGLGRSQFLPATPSHRRAFRPRVLSAARGCSYLGDERLHRAGVAGVELVARRELGGDLAHRQSSVGIAQRIENGSAA
jgi:hypothetical protein